MILKVTANKKMECKSQRDTTENQPQSRTYKHTQPDERQQTNIKNMIIIQTDSQTDKTDERETRERQSIVYQVRSRSVKTIIHTNTQTNGRKQNNYTNGMGSSSFDGRTHYDQRLYFDFGKLSRGKQKRTDRITQRRNSNEQTLELE